AFRTGNVLINLRNPLANSAFILAVLGKESEALERHRETRLLLERLARTGLGATAGRAHHILGRASLTLGRLDEAQTLAEHALEGSHLQFGVKANALYLLGSIAARPERLDVERSRACYYESLALAKPRGMRPLIARCHFGLGKLHQHIGQS